MMPWIETVCSTEFLWAWIALAVVTAAALTRTTAPYGRHGRAGWGPTVGPRAAWFWMEISALVGIGACVAASDTLTPHSVLVASIYGGHYVYRSLIYPMLSPPSAARASIWVVVMAFAFNVVNSSVLGGWGVLLWPELGLMLSDAVGLVLVVLGFTVHFTADAHLRGLRVNHGPGYHIPQGGLYRWVSCPNYLGELIQWLGLAVVMDALAGWTFFIWTAANLLPRAVQHHRWYIHRFQDYPSDRKAVLPGLL